MQNYPNKKVFIGVFLLIALFAVVVVLFFHNMSEKLSGKLSHGMAQFESGINDLKNLNPADAQEKFSGLMNEFTFSPNTALQGIMMLLSGAGDSIAGFGSAAQEVASLAGDLDYLQSNLMPIVFNKKGDVLLARLRSISAHLKAIQDEEGKFDAATARLNSIASSSMDSYISLKLDLSNARELVDALIALLGSTSPRHFLALFQNSSELRPAGGFLGSYADITIQDGNIAQVDIRDISDPDKQLDLKTVPPLELQAIVKNWRAADTNWFFDFPESAATTLHFIEASHLYADRNISFDGAIAISPKVIEDVLNVVGPVAVAGTTFTRDNFLVLTQKMVQDGQARLVEPPARQAAKRTGQAGEDALQPGSVQATYPKKILSKLGGALFASVASSSASTTDFLGMASDWISHKDVMMYLKDAQLQSFADQYNMSGKIYTLPNNFLGDYVALVEANIGGGKSDLFLKRDVLVASQINLDGTVDDRVTVSLEHDGNTSQYWWYRVPAQEYLQLFAPPSGRITNFSGGVVKKIVPPIDYVKNGYVQNPLVLGIESSTEKDFTYPALFDHPELGKKVFSTWASLKPGEKMQIVFVYTHRLFLAPVDGESYRFVFEKQSGTERNYSFSISAPPGFVFAESNLPIFQYSSDNPLGRTDIALTFKKIQSSQ